MKTKLLRRLRKGVRIKAMSNGRYLVGTKCIIQEGNTYWDSIDVSSMQGAITLVHKEIRRKINDYIKETSNKIYP